LFHSVKQDKSARSAGCQAVSLLDHRNNFTEEHIISGGASAAKEPGHFKVRTSLSQVTWMLFSSNELTFFLFLVVALKTQRPSMPLRLFHCQNKTNKVVCCEIWQNFYLLILLPKQSKATGRAEPGQSQGGGSSSQVHALVYSCHCK